MVHKAVGQGNQADLKNYYVTNRKSTINQSAPYISQLLSHESLSERPPHTVTHMKEGDQDVKK